jgi:hypothetical protein
MCKAVDNELTGMAWVAGLMGYGAPASSGAGKTYFEARRPWDAVEPFE